MNNTLTHHGVLGMKWGVRRYQNKDGTLTASGRRRLGNISDNGKKVNFDERGKIETGSSNKGKARSAIREEVSNDYRQLSNASNSASSASRTISNMARQSANHQRNQAASKMDLSKMSDSELRSRINRMNMEKQYKYLSTEQISSGRDRVSDILSTAGDVLAVGSSAASIAVAIHTLKK